MSLVYAETIEKINQTKAAVIGPLGLVLVDAYARSEALVRADSGWVERAEKGLQSAFVAPEVSGDLGFPSHNLDVAMAAGELAASAGAASLTSSPAEIFIVAAGAQAASTSADGLVAHENWLSRPEAHHLDVGPSAIISAFVMKFLMDKRREAASAKAKQIYTGATATFATGMTVLASYVDRKNGTLDFTSHAAGLAVGALASWVKGRRQKQSELTDNAAAEALVT